MANARIAAGRERADREAGIEDRRLDAEGRYAGLRSSAEMDLGKEATDTARRSEALPVAVNWGPVELLDKARESYQQGRYNDAIVYLFSYELIALDRRHLVRLARG